MYNFHFPSQVLDEIIAEIHKWPNGTANEMALAIQYLCKEVTKLREENNALALYVLTKTKETQIDLEKVGQEYKNQIAKSKRCGCPFPQYCGCDAG